MLVGALRVFPRTVLPRHRPKSSMRQTGADSPAPSQTVHWTVCVPLWRERAVRIPSLREKQKALSPDSERAFCGRSDGIRTHGLLVPNQARYQLRYTPSAYPLYVFFQRLSRLNFHQLRMMCAAGLNIPDATVCPAVLPYQAHMFTKGLQEWRLHVL